MPHCKKCDKDHFNFTPCAMVDTFEADRAEKARRLQNLAQPQLRPRGNDWGNRYGRGDYIQHGDTNVMVIRGRKAEHPIKSPTYIPPQKYEIQQGDT